MIWSFGCIDGCTVGFIYKSGCVQGFIFTVNTHLLVYACISNPES